MKISKCNVTDESLILIRRISELLGKMVSIMGGVLIPLMIIFFSNFFMFSSS